MFQIFEIFDTLCVKFHGTSVCLYAVVLLYVVAGTNSLTAVMSCQQLGFPLVVDKLSFKIGAPETKHSVLQ